MIRSYLFTPAQEARFTDRAHQRGADAVLLDGKMIDPPVVARAQAVLAMVFRQKSRA